MVVKNNSYVDGFVKRFIGEKHDDNAIISPLGAWVNLVVLSYSVKDDLTSIERAEIERVLDSKIENAFESLKILYSSTPDFVSFAIGFWGLDTFSGMYNLIADTLIELGEGLVFEGKPSNTVVDPWVFENSKGLIETFPVDLSSSDVESVLANILALKIDWDEPYDEVEAPVEMGFWDSDKVLLKDSESDGFTKIFQVDGEFFGVHSSTKTYKNYGFSVTVHSFVANEGVDKKALHSMIQQYLIYPQSLSTVDSEFFKNHSLDFVRSEIVKVHAANSEPIYSAYYPSWSAGSTTDLNSTDGFSVLKEVFNRNNLDIDNQQVSVSSYDKDGFEAAALTYSMITATSFSPVLEHEVAFVDVFFDKPFFTATTVNITRGGHKNSWYSLPLFISYVCKN